MTVLSLVFGLQLVLSLVEECNGKSPKDCSPWVSNQCGICEVNTCRNQTCCWCHATVTGQMCECCPVGYECCKAETNARGKPSSGKCCPVGTICDRGNCVSCERNDVTSPVIAVDDCTDLIDFSIFVDDNYTELYFDGVRSKHRSSICAKDSWKIPPETKLVAIMAEDFNTFGEIKIETSDGRLRSDRTWKCLATAPHLAPTDWMKPDYNDDYWPSAVEVYESLYDTDLIIDVDEFLNHLYIDGVEVPLSQLPNWAKWHEVDSLPMTRPPRVIAIDGTNTAGPRMIVASTTDAKIKTGLDGWECMDVYNDNVPAGWMNEDFVFPQHNVRIVDDPSVWPMDHYVAEGINPEAHFIWTMSPNEAGRVLCRAKFNTERGIWTAGYRGEEKNIICRGHFAPPKQPSQNGCESNACKPLCAPGSQCCACTTDDYGRICNCCPKGTFCCGFATPGGDGGCCPVGSTCSEDFKCISGFSVARNASLRGDKCNSKP